MSLSIYILQQMWRSDRWRLQSPQRPSYYWCTLPAARSPRTDSSPVSSSQAEVRVGHPAASLLVGGLVIVPNVLYQKILTYACRNGYSLLSLQFLCSKRLFSSKYVAVTSIVPTVVQSLFLKIGNMIPIFTQPLLSTMGTRISTSIQLCLFLTTIQVSLGDGPSIKHYMTDWGYPICHHNLMTGSDLFHYSGDNGDNWDFLGISRRQCPNVSSPRVVLKCC